MKLSLLLLLVVCLSIISAAAPTDDPVRHDSDGDQEVPSPADDDLHAHWTKRIRTLFQNPNSNDFALPSANFKIVTHNATEKNEKTLENRYPFNPLKPTIISTPEVLDQSWINAMVFSAQTLGPDAIWNKFNKRASDSGMEAPPFSMVVDLAIGDVAMFIKMYKKSVEAACSNLNSTLTIQGDTKKSSVLQKAMPKIKKCASLQTDLIDKLHRNRAIEKMYLPDSVLSMVVHEATFIYEDYTDEAARIVMLTMLARDEECFRQFDKDHAAWAERMRDFKKETQKVTAVLEERKESARRDQEINILYDLFVDVFNSPQFWDMLRQIPEFVGALNPKTGTPCGQNLMKSMIQVALELDLKRESAMYKRFMALGKDLFKPQT